jgi:hypothetical protein
MRRAGAVLLFAAGLASATVANATVVRPSTRPREDDGLRARVGADRVRHLLQSAAPSDRLQGIARAAALGTPEAISALSDAIERNSLLKADARAVLATARALARHTSNERAIAGLIAIVTLGAPLASPRGAGTHEDPDPAARVDLARTIAAAALARSNVPRALDALLSLTKIAATTEADETSKTQGAAAALRALSTYPPQDPAFLAKDDLPLSLRIALARAGDLRVLSRLSELGRTADARDRAAILTVLGEAGDHRALALAEAAATDRDPRARIAAAEAFSRLGAEKEAVQSLEALLADDTTAEAAFRIAERVSSPTLTTLIAARAWTHPRREFRVAALRSLGRSSDPNAATALLEPRVFVDPELRYEGLVALARSPAPNALALLEHLGETHHARLAVRAYLVRAIEKGERSRRLDDATRRLAASDDANSKALGTFALRELGLLDAQEAPTVTRSGLEARAFSPGPDAFIASYMLAQITDAPTLERLFRTIGASALGRVHVVRGLGLSPLADATGRLAELYVDELDADVRLAVIRALSERSKDANAPARKGTLTLAAELDPDTRVRHAAARALEGAPALSLESPRRSVAWLRVSHADGSTPTEPVHAAVRRADGFALPVVFDDEGFALVVGVAHDATEVVFAPRFPDARDERSGVR